MSNGAAGAAAGGAAAAAAIANAIKASGAIVSVRPSDLMSILSKNASPLVVVAQGGLIKKNYQYLTGYKGLVSFTKSTAPLQLKTGIELITAEKMWIPA